MKDLLPAFSNSRALTSLYGQTLAKAAKPTLQTSSTANKKPPKQSDQAALQQKIQSSLNAALKYVQSHKVESALFALALGTIAYLSLSKIESSSPPHEWTLSGPLNLAALQGSEKVCSYILSLKTDSILNAANKPVLKISLNTPSDHPLSLSYSLYIPKEVNPLALLIHNHCQREAKAYKNLVLDPNFKTDNLISLIVAAASAHNTPLWIELTTALLQNKGLNAMDEDAKQAQIHSVILASQDAAKRAPSTGAACLNSFNLKTAYDPSINIKEVLKATEFNLKIVESQFTETYAQMKAQKFKSEIDLNKTPEEQSLTISNIYPRLEQADISGKILEQIKKDPVYALYFSKE